MPTLDRSELRWNAPTTNVDGTPIDYPLDYELGSRPAGDVQEPTPLFSVVGTLQGDGSYLAPLTQMAWDTNGQYELFLRAINRDDPAAISGWNDPILLTVSSSIPNPPVWVGA
jgi:hypothetical protein